eukprot:scaffold2129_cov318-Prasinococcus_capsulatus_cf.AAC.4
MCLALFECVVSVDTVTRTASPTFDTAARPADIACESPPICTRSPTSGAAVSVPAATRRNPPSSEHAANPPVVPQAYHGGRYGGHGGDPLAGGARGAQALRQRRVHIVDVVGHAHRQCAGAAAASGAVR